MELKDSVSIITGGASGLGEATVRKFHALGSKVCIFDLDDRNGKNLENELLKNCVFYSITRLISLKPSSFIRFVVNSCVLELSISK